MDKSSESITDYNDPQESLNSLLTELICDLREIAHQHNLNILDKCGALDALITLLD
jgi:hypothetical protein